MRKIQSKNLGRTIFELSLSFLFLQQTVFPSQLSFVAEIILLVCGLYYILKSKRIYFNPFITCFILLLCYASVFAFIGYGLNSWYQIMFLGGQALTSLTIYNYLLSDKDNIDRYILNYIIVSSIGVMLIWLLLRGDVFSNRMGHNGSGSTISYYIGNTPIYKSSNATGNICAVAILFILYYKDKYKNCIKGLWIYYFLIVFLTVSLLACGSRKAFLAFVIYLFFYLISYKKIKVKILLILIIPVIAYFILFQVDYIYNSITKRMISLLLNLSNQINTDDASSYLERMRLLSRAREMISEKPLWGYGFGVFAAEAGNGAENNFLQLMVTFGIFGTVIFYAFLPSMISTGASVFKSCYIMRMFSIIVFTMLIQDFGSVSYSWQRVTVFYSIFYAVAAYNGKPSKFLKL